MPETRKSVMAFLQARMGSTRLPGKVMMPIQGRTVLQRAIERLRAASIVDWVAVLTTTQDHDSIVAEEAVRLGALVYRGPEQDVLRRFQEAAEEFQPSVIIRATADNPLIDIGSVNRIVETLNEGNLDFCMENELPYGAATEACTASALEKAHLLAREPSDREHVTLFIKGHPEMFQVRYLIAPNEVRHPEIRVTIDTPEDMNNMRRLIACLPESDGPVALDAYIPFAMEHSFGAYPVNTGDMQAGGLKENLRPLSYFDDMAKGGTVTRKGQA